MGLYRYVIQHAGRSVWRARVPEYKKIKGKKVRVQKYIGKPESTELGAAKVVAKHLKQPVATKLHSYSYPRCCRDDF